MPLALSLLALLVFLFSGCNPGAARTHGNDGTTFVTLLGSDTVAVEHFTRTADGVEADVLLRPPQTSRTHYRLYLDEQGRLMRYEAAMHAPTSNPASLLRREVVLPHGDSLQVTVTEGGTSTTRTVSGNAHALPFIDMVHWPFELALTRVRATGQDSVMQPLFTDRGALPFVVRDLGGEHMSLTHPFRGTMDVRVDADGRLQRLDAGATTRKLAVTREAHRDMDALAVYWTARDAAGDTFGPLSGRGETRATVDGAEIVVDYGQPAKRGRDIFGALVPWGELWRTGANRATHLRTSRALRMGGLTVPAGEYTLYTIPRADGGLLIINRQTGQGGTTYDPHRDLGRVDMTVESLPAPSELFSIDVEDTEEGGLLRLHWDDTAFVVPFTVR